MQKHTNKNTRLNFNQGLALTEPTPGQPTNIKALYIQSMVRPNRRLYRPNTEVNISFYSRQSNVVAVNCSKILITVLNRVIY